MKVMPAAGPRRRALDLLPVLLACACGAEPEAPIARPPAGASPSYHDVWQLGTHNSYWVDRKMGDAFASGPGERLLDQLLVHRARALEIDVHRGEAPHVFRVYHGLPDNSLCDTLDECLAVLRAFHYTLPEHQPVVVILELKELFAPFFDAAHTVEDLDRTLAAGLGDLLYRPADFLAACDGHDVPTLAECARRAGWPSLAALRGRFLFTVLGNWDLFGGQNSREWVSYATAGDIHDRAAFPMASSWLLDWSELGPALQELVTSSELARAVGDSVFLQEQELDHPLAAAFIEQGGVVRVDNEFEVTRQGEAVARGMQILQTDTPWIAYRDGGPLRPTNAISPDVEDEELREPGHRLSLGPAEGGRVFAHHRAAAGAGATWETVVSTGTDATRAGCLRAAAASVGGEGTSVTLCRHALQAAGTLDAGKLVLRLEICETGACRTDEYLSEDRTPGGPGEILSLSIEPRGAQTCVSARAARLADPLLTPIWAPLGPARCVAGELPLRGIARPAAPGAQSAVYFFATRRDGAPVRSTDLDTVTIEPTTGGQPTTDAAKLADTSWP